MSNIKTISIISILILLCLAPFTIYIYFNFNQVNNFTEEISQIDESKIISTSSRITDPLVLRILETDNKDAEIWKKNSTPENINEYLNLIDTKIASPENNKHSKDLLLMRKAIALSLNRDANFSNNLEEATNIYINLINTNNIITGTSSYIRDFSIISLVRLHNECCSTSGTDDPLFDKKINGFTFKYDSYRNEGYSRSLAKFLTLLDMTKLVSSTNNIDIAHKINTLDLRARILLVYGNKLAPSLKVKITEDLGKDIELTKNVRAITYTDPVTVRIYYRAIFIFANDVYLRSRGNITKDENTFIDNNYELIGKISEADFPTGVDPIGMNQVKFYNYLRYLQSIEARYGQKKDMIKVNETINKIMDLIDSSSAIKAVATNGFKSQDFKDGILLGFLNLSTLKNVNPRLYSFLTSIGI